jgi:hypothetical protein
MSDPKRPPTGRGLSSSVPGDTDPDVRPQADTRPGEADLRKETARRPDPANENELLDEALRESFPASDPAQPAQPGVTGWDAEDKKDKR